jgi:hypothetical protein
MSTHTHRERERQRQRQRQRETEERQTDKQTEGDRDREKQIDRQTETDRQRQTETEKQSERETKTEGHRDVQKVFQCISPTILFRFHSHLLSISPSSNGLMCMCTRIITLLDMGHRIAHPSQTTVAVIIHLSLNLSMKIRSFPLYHLYLTAFLFTTKDQEQLPLIK